ncbi:MAG: sugar phosphate nucleotidyltransferase [Fibrobacter sp.]|nr:sugar phosphate nucleotidyltransferase [Fibrobacter sp.]
MRGFILSAGFGTRLRPLTNHIPKALVPVCGKVLLEHALQKLTNAGIKSIATNAHYLTEQIESFGEHSPYSFKIFRETDKILGTGGGLYFARDFLAGESSFIVMNVDIISNFDLKNVIETFEKSDSVCMLVAFKPATGNGTILYEKDSLKYIGVSKDNTKNAALMGADFIGMALYKKEFLDFLTPSDFSIVPVWERAVKCGAKVTVCLQESGYWRDVGTLKSLAQIHFDCIDGIINNADPCKFTIDKKRKCCVVKNADRNLIDACGNYSWVELQGLPSGCQISESVVFEGSSLPKNSHVTRSLVTQWGIISYDNN